jgi:mono/diheme cytochrome c family protein
MLGALALLAAGWCAAQQKPLAPEKTALAAGAKFYRENCAVCHGSDGKGNGPPPTSSSFTEPPPDLTTLRKRHDGTFPDAYVESVLRNGVSLPDHGPAEMPVWGTILKATMKSDEAKITQRIKNLTDYLRSIQDK